RSLALGVFAGAGSRHDPPRQHGLAHFTEHMLFKGTKRRTPKRIVIQAESVGGSLNAYTSEEHTCYHVRSPAKHLKRMIDLLADMYADSTFPETEIGQERQVIEDEILTYRDEPSSHVDDLLSEITWPGHALGRPILG
ncbi:MAG: M16 family metallopeptidase, partial [Verrucomicrobiales bacterium]